MGGVMELRPQAGRYCTALQSALKFATGSDLLQQDRADSWSRGASV